MRFSFEDALRASTVGARRGGDRLSRLRRHGRRPGHEPEDLPACQGSGVVSDSHGLFALSQPCPRCGGNGVIIEKPCKNCRGSGRERMTKRYQVKVPPGERTGRASGSRARASPVFRAGRPATSRRRHVSILRRSSSAEGPTSSRRSGDLPEAALGATVEIPTPEGPVALKVPAGSENGKLLG